ncbi:MAG: hypothetical protein ACOCZ6_04340, partial [Nanoarchaeota archaeon]
FRDEDEESKRDKIVARKEEFSEIMEEIENAATEDCVYKRKPFDEFNKALRGRTSTTNTINVHTYEFSGFLDDVSCLQKVQELDNEKEIYLFKSNHSTFSNIYFFATFDKEGVASDSYLKHLSATIHATDENNYTYGEIIPEPDDDIKFVDSSPVTERMEVDESPLPFFGTSEIQFDGDNEYAKKLKPVLEERAKDDCGGEVPDDENDEDEEIKFDEFNEALRDENKITTMPLEASQFGYLTDSIECKDRLALNKFLFKGEVNKKHVYVIAEIYESGSFRNEMVEDSCLEVLNATLSEDGGDVQDYDRAKEKFGQITERLKVDKSDYCSSGSSNDVKFLVSRYFDISDCSS